MNRQREKGYSAFTVHFKSIRSTMIFSFGILIVMALLPFFMISLSYTEETVLDNSKNYTGQLIEQVNSELNSYISYMENISQMVTKNADVTAYMFGSQTNDVQQDRVLSLFETVMDTRADILNIAVVADNGKALINRGNSRLNENVELSDMPWYQETMEAEGKAIVSSSHVQNAIAGSYKWVVTLSKALINPQTGKAEGIFFIDLNYSAINTLCEKISLGKRGYIFIEDKKGSLIYHPQQQLVQAGLKTESTDKVLQMENGSFIEEEGMESRLYTIRSSEETGWTVAGVSYVRELMKDENKTQVAYLLIATALFILAMALSVVLASEIIRPLAELKESMKEVQKGNFDHAEFVTRGENEIASLGNAFNIMTEKIQDLMEENVQEQIQKRKMELNALQSQINPHFLYNTLDSIIWMGESGKNKEVVLMTSSLAKLLRQSISNEDEIVTIDRELSYTRSYLEIQKMRYRDELEFEMDVDREILKKSIVKLVVQPIVENAIYHGIKNMETKGMIYITGTMDDSKVVLIIQDNGVGMDEQTLEKILDNKHADTKSSKVGVYNVHNRLQLYYGKEYGLSYKSMPECGTTVYITIPNPNREEWVDE